MRILFFMLFNGFIYHVYAETAVTPSPGSQSKQLLQKENIARPEAVITQMRPNVFSCTKTYDYNGTPVQLTIMYELAPGYQQGDWCIPGAVVSSFGAITSNGMTYASGTPTQTAFSAACGPCYYARVDEAGPLFETPKNH